MLHGCVLAPGTVAQCTLGAPPGADRNLVITCIENISRDNERRFVSTLAEFAQTLDHSEWNGPLIILVGIGDHEAVQPLSVLDDLAEASDGRY